MHLYAGSIKVKIGDVVDYGQVIGKIGNSGDSTGPHLHIDMKLNGKFVDATKYIDPNNPRPSTNYIDLFSKWIEVIEGGNQYITSEGWVVHKIKGGDNTMNLPHGMVVASYDGGDSWYPSIIPGKIHVGQIVSEEKALQIYEQKLAVFINAIDVACMNNNVTLETHQKVASMSYIYRVGQGYANGLIKAYAEGGNKGLWNFMKDTHEHRTEYINGVKARVAEEYELFTTGDYSYAHSGTSKYDEFCRNN